MIEEYRGKEAQRQAQRVAHTVKEASVPTESKGVVYNCGCSLNGTLFRRANGCRLERLKH